MLLFLVSPIFLLCFKKKALANIFLIFALILLLFQKQLPSWKFGFEYSFSLRGLLFFPLGIYFAFYPLDHNRFQAFRKMLPILWGIAAITESLLISSHFGFFGHVAMVINTLFGIGAVWVFPDFFPSLLHLGDFKFAKDSFFLYAIHNDILAILFCNQVEKILIYKLYIPVFIVFLLRAALALILSLFIAKLLKQFQPKVYRILSGGR